MRGSTPGSNCNTWRTGEGSWEPDTQKQRGRQRNNIFLDWSLFHQTMRPIPCVCAEEAFEPLESQSTRPGEGLGILVGTRWFMRDSSGRPWRGLISLHNPLGSRVGLAQHSTLSRSSKNEESLGKGDMVGLGA